MPGEPAEALLQQVEQEILLAQQPFFHQPTSMDAADILRKNDIR
jgi:hypothetical protein